MESNGALEVGNFCKPHISNKLIDQCYSTMAAYNPLWLLRSSLGLKTMDFLSYVRYKHREKTTANTLRGIEKGTSIYWPGDVPEQRKGPTMRMIYKHVHYLTAYAESERITDKLKGCSESDLIIGYVDWDKARERQLESLYFYLIKLKPNVYVVHKDHDTVGSLLNLEEFANDCTFIQKFITPKG